MKQILTLLFVQLYMHTITRKMISFYNFYLISRCSPYMHDTDAHKNENTSVLSSYPHWAYDTVSNHCPHITCMNSNLPGH